MVDSVGLSRIVPVTQGKPVVGGSVDKSKRDREQPSKDNPEKDREHDQERVGANIDERC